MVMANSDFLNAPLRGSLVTKDVIEDAQDVGNFMSNQCDGLPLDMPIGRVSMTKRVAGNLVLYVTPLFTVDLFSAIEGFENQTVIVPSYCTANDLRRFVNPLPDCDFGFLSLSGKMFTRDVGNDENPQTIADLRDYDLRNPALVVIELVPMVIYGLSGRPYRFLLNAYNTTVEELEDMLGARYREIHGGNPHPPFNLRKSNDLLHILPRDLPLNKCQISEGVFSFNAVPV
jgi:hypothetical protein